MAGPSALVGFGNLSAPHMLRLTLPSAASFMLGVETIRQLLFEPAGAEPAMVVGQLELG